MTNNDRKGHFFHVTHDKQDNQWHVKEVKGDEVRTFNNKDDAVKAAETMATKSSEMGHVVIHDEKGHFVTTENF
jgi:hypothetical protein